MPDPSFLVSLHDVSPRHERAVETILSDLSDWGIPPALLLVVPDFHGRWPLAEHPSFAERLREWNRAGHELCLHGHVHMELAEDAAAAAGLGGALRRRFLTAGEGEFLSLRGERLESRLDAAIATWNACGLPIPEGFVPPAWLRSDELAAALWRRGFHWTEDHSGFLAPTGSVPAPVVTWASRDPLRRIGSRLYAPAALRAWKGRSRVRIAIHPHDWDHPSLVASVRRTLDDAGRERTAWRGTVRNWIIPT